MRMGANTIIGTVCVTTRMGYRQRRTTGNASIKTPSKRPSARAISMPSTASEEVTSACESSVEKLSASAESTSIGPGSTYKGTLNARTQISHSANSAMTTSHGSGFCQFFPRMVFVPFPPPERKKTRPAEMPQARKNTLFRLFSLRWHYPNQVLRVEADKLPLSLLQSKLPEYRYVS